MSVSRLKKRDNRTKSGCRLPTYATKNEENVFIKLLQLENFEEELGVDLITLFNKALKDGIYIDLGNIVIFKPSLDLSLKFYLGKWYIAYYHSLNGKTFYVDLKDFNKTWWIEKPKEKGNG